MDGIFLPCHAHQHLPFLRPPRRDSRVKRFGAPDATELSSGASSINIRLHKSIRLEGFKVAFIGISRPYDCRRSRRRPVRSKTIYLLDL